MKIKIKCDYKYKTENINDNKIFTKLRVNGRIFFIIKHSEASRFWESDEDETIRIFEIISMKEIINMKD